MPSVSIFNALLLCFVALVSLGSSKAGLGEKQKDVSPRDFQATLKLRPLVVEFFDFYQNLTLTGLTSVETTDEQDNECLEDIHIVLQGLSSDSQWALQMIDSWGSLPSGVLVGNRRDLGNYEECLSIDHSVNSSYSLQGKYCFAKISSISVNTAVCFPASCTANQVDTMIRSLVEKLLNLVIDEDEVVVNEATCQTAEQEPLDGVTIFTIILLSILTTTCVLSTLYDYNLCEDQKQLPALVKVFSVRANSRALFHIVDSKSNPNVINCLNGMRCLSLMWVILLHEYLVGFRVPNVNRNQAYSWLGTPFSKIITNGVYAVDTFLFVSGLLVVANGLRAIEKSKGKINVLMMYLHRYLRLTPVVAVAILIYMKILPLLGGGPIFSSALPDDYSVCEKTWYWTLLYLQNYATDTLCLTHTWYLAVDMQLYLFGPLFLIILYKWGNKGAAGIFVLMLLLASCLFSKMVIYNLSMNIPEAQRSLYHYTNSRTSPYIVGALFGYFLHINRGRTFKLNRIAVFFGWILSLSLIFTCLFANYESATMTIIEEAFYLTLIRIAWPLGLSWIVFACLKGYGGMATGFLSSPLWQPLSKLSYSGYIFHMFMMSLQAGVTRTNTFFGNYQIMCRFWADFGFTMLMAYVVYVLVEAPFGVLESLLLPTRRPISKDNPNAVLQSKTGVSPMAAEAVKSGTNKPEQTDTENPALSPDTAEISST
ncbi:uncharacterized protein Dwil_GK13563 [Drosophila willistoni]|uniref:Nose resistant-to-fluoxetine protein N-terminal domain-containing protein n=1 Tax=Drosophila willistoni TaxID=7260 RepID=B4NI03_DROWI|nr:nose resistant to fluoxetine protein 6 [Drosophila willistoni]EDW83653.2 uncharacterized protein Dwil_GK13563 [Drosophila willistoni]